MAKKLKTISPRITDTSEAFFSSNFDNRSAGAEFILAAFPALYARTLHLLKGKFTAGELSLMIDVANGQMLNPAMAGQHILASVTDGCELDSLDEKWQVSQLDLFDKIAAIPLFDRACLEIWSCAYWTDCERDISAYIAQLV
jgi:hypothetical protein